MSKSRELSGGGYKRESNFELLRILLMIAIIAHHYVVNSGIEELYDFTHITANMIFLQVFGMFGKIGINGFTLITGYFMVTSHITSKKFIRLYLQVKFWYILFYIIFLATGYESFSLKTMLKSLLNVIYEAGSLYTGTFLVFFLAIPFLNLLIHTMNQKQYQTILVLLLTYFTIISTFFKHDTFQFVGWLGTMYLIGGYIRLYPCKYVEEQKYSIILGSGSLILGILSIIIVDFIGSQLGFENYYYLLSNAHKFLALTSSISIFLFFKNLKVPYHKNVNILASATFGILLIHTNCDAMRRFLWQDLLQNTHFYDSALLPLHAFFSVSAVYLVCFGLEQIRSKLIERPMLHLFKKTMLLLKH